MAEMLKEFRLGRIARLARRGFCRADCRKDFGIGSSGFQERFVRSIGDERESTRLDIKRDVFRKDIACNQRQEFRFAERARTAASDRLRGKKYPDEADEEGER